jgi:prepilin-type N-terminal cleavage/methylation domain-containing protein
MPSRRRAAAFTIIEILVVVAIIGLLATIVVVALGGTMKKGRDTKRKADLSLFGRFLAGGCIMPDAGAGEHDFADVVSEILAKNPQYAQMIGKIPRDPKVGSDEDSYYRYAVSSDGKKCAVYANLENENEPVTIPHLTAPTPGGGTGVIQSASVGWNGTDRYFEVTN